MILAVYGSRTWKNHALIYQAIETCAPRLVVHGGHWSGADQFAYDYCDRNGLLQVKIEAPWSNTELGKAAGPFRNGVVLLTAFLYGDWYQEPVFTLGFRKEGTSAGTDDMHEKCEKAKVQQKISLNICQGAEDWTLVLEDGSFGELVRQHTIEGFAPVR